MSISHRIPLGAGSDERATCDTRHGEVRGSRKGPGDEIEGLSNAERRESRLCFRQSVGAGAIERCSLVHKAPHVGRPLHAEQHETRCQEHLVRKVELHIRPPGHARCECIGKCLRDEKQWLLRFALAASLIPCHEVIESRRGGSHVWHESDCPVRHLLPEKLRDVRTNEIACSCATKTVAGVTAPLAFGPR